MSYYNRNHEKLKLSNMKYLNSGDNAKVSYNAEMIFKEYYFETVLNFRLSEKMFDILKNINNPHFIELFDIYSDFDSVKLLKNKIGMFPFTIDSYTARYYPDNSINVLFEHKDYILDNFRELEILFGIFTENMIRTHDIKRDNAIIGKDGIIIIDPDLFRTTKMPKEVLSSLNKKELLYLFRDIIINSLESEPNYKKLVFFIDSELFNLEVTDNTDIAYEISKKLKYIKKPIELFRR